MVRWRRSKASTVAYGLLILLALRDPDVRAEEPTREAAIERAVMYLAREVQSWPEEKYCFSCHNSGDGARALVIARQYGYDVPSRSLDANVTWLQSPEKWHAGGEDEPFKDARLAAVQFAAALLALQPDGAGEGGDKRPLEAAAGILAEFQDENGAWQMDLSGLGGSPITYGDALATVLSRRTLAAARPDRFAAEIAAADHWLRANRSQRIVDAAAILWVLADAEDAAARDQRARCLKLLLAAQAKTGGWGLFANRETEPFDTALAIIALASVDEKTREAAEEAQRAIDRGCEYLLAMQSPDGSWPETTRPGGGQSYAHRVSTTAWSTIALLTASPR